MIRMEDLLLELQGRKVRLYFTNGEIADVILEDFIYNTEVDKKGQKIDVLWGIKAEYKQRKVYWRFESIDDFEEIQEGGN